MTLDRKRLILPGPGYSINRDEVVQVTDPRTGRLDRPDPSRAQLLSAQAKARAVLRFAELRGSFVVDMSRGDMSRAAAMLIAAEHRQVLGELLGIAWRSGHPRAEALFNTLASRWADDAVTAAANRGEFDNAKHT